LRDEPLSSWLSPRLSPVVATGAALVIAVSCTRPLVSNGRIDPGRLEEIVALASTASELAVLAPVSAELLTRAELRALLDEQARRFGDDEAQEGVADAMGEGSPRDEARDLLLRTARGVYLHDTRTLYLVDEHARGKDGEIHLGTLGDLGNEITLTHEVVHALQHQNYPHLFDRDAFPRNHRDAAVALGAALEGNATFAAANSLGFIGRPRLPGPPGLDAREGGPLSSEDPLAREQISFAYEYGYRIAYYEGRELLDEPPASTEQVIHWERSGDRRPFSAIDLSELRRTLEERYCGSRSENTMGELGISHWLRVLLPTTDASAAEGWDGDRWIQVGCAGRREVAWLTSWDTQADAIEFERAVGAVRELWRRGEPGSPLVTHRVGHEVAVMSEGLPIAVDAIPDMAARGRVVTRDDLKAHFER
jgi:hypothetical protein